VLACETQVGPERNSHSYRLNPVTELSGDELIELGGHAVVLAGDTLPCAGLDRLCVGADVLVHTVIRDQGLRHRDATLGESCAPRS